MKLAVVGSRDFTDESMMAEYMSIIMSAYQEHELVVPNVTIISGGAKGADMLSEVFALAYQVPMIIFKPNWDKFGKGAGFIRNQQIVDACDMVLAFWDGKSKGTKHTIDLAHIAKKPTFIVYY